MEGDARKERILFHFPLLAALPDAHLAPLLVLGSIQGFFSNLNRQLLLFAGAWATFFFSWAAILYSASGVTGSERTRTYAIAALYAALMGLALALLAATIASIITSAATGQ